MIRRALLDIVTTKDGETHDIGRWGGVVSLLVGLGLEVYVVWRGAPFDILQFGAGIAALAAGIGAMLKLKETTES